LQSEGKTLFRNRRDMSVPDLCPALWQKAWQERLRCPFVSGFNHSNTRPIFLIEEFRSEPAEDVIHHRLGDGDLLIIGEAGWFKTHVAEFFDLGLEGYPVLER
jgi:hypothetical protein